MVVAAERDSDRRLNSTILAAKNIKGLFPSINKQKKVLHNKPFFQQSPNLGILLSPD